MESRREGAKVRSGEGVGWGRGGQGKAGACSLEEKLAKCLAVQQYLVLRVNSVSHKS